jgi:hypothetical protein
MVWLQAFPQANTFVSNVGQTQANWLFLQNNINTDHYFNVGNNTEGHHRYVQTSSAAAPGVAAGMSGVLFNNIQGAQNLPQLFWQENVSNTIREVATLNGAAVVVINDARAPLVNLINTPFISGIITAYDINNPINNATAFVIWANIAGGTIYVTQLAIDGTVNAIYADTQGTHSTVLLNTPGGDFRWNLFTIPN